MPSNVDNATLFLVNTLFSLFAYTLILRILMQLVRVDFYNPLAQFVWKVTNPPTQIFRHIIPRYRKIDLPAVLVLYLVAGLNIGVDLLILGYKASILAILWLALLKSLVLCINVLTFSILIQAVMSWFGASMHSPAASLLWNLNEPMLRPIRRVVPPIGGLDLSPLFVIIALQVVNRLIPLSHLLR